MSASVTPLRGKPSAYAHADDFSFSDTLPRQYTTQQTIEALQARGINFDLLNHDTHIKIGHVNYYPSRGSVMLDGHRKFARRGFDFLLEVLRREGYYSGT